MKHRSRLASFVSACTATALGIGCASSGPPSRRGVDPLEYVCHRAASSIVIDGRLDDAAWQNASWTEHFGDIEGKWRSTPRHETHAKILWDEEFLYVGAWMDDPHLWSTLLDRDAVIWHDNDFEVFLDPNGDTRNYFEIEVNLHNTVFDLFLVRPYSEGGPALHDWDLSGLRTAVHLDGTLNDPSDTDIGWSVEMALPWRSLRLDDEHRVPPRDGDVWRMNFSRVQWRLEVSGDSYVKVPDQREDNWSWSPQGAIDMHRPERWGFVEFSGP